MQNKFCNLGISWLIVKMSKGFSCAIMLDHSGHFMDAWSSYFEIQLMLTLDMFNILRKIATKLPNFLRGGKMHSFSSFAKLLHRYTNSLNKHYTFTVLLCWTKTKRKTTHFVLCKKAGKCCGKFFSIHCSLNDIRQLMGLQKKIRHKRSLKVTSS